MLQRCYELKSLVSALKVLIAVMKVALVLSIFLTGYTIFSVLGSSLSSLTGESSFSSHINPDGSLSVSSALEVENRGYLDSSVYLEIRILFDGSVLASGNDHLHLRPGESGTLNIQLAIPEEDLSRLMVSKPETEIYLGIRTLNNLTGISLKGEVSE